MDDLQKIIEETKREHAHYQGRFAELTGCGDIKAEGLANSFIVRRYASLLQQVIENDIPRPLEDVFSSTVELSLHVGSI